MKNARIRDVILIQKLTECKKNASDLKNARTKDLIQTHFDLHCTKLSSEISINVLLLD